MDGGVYGGDSERLVLVNNRSGFILKLAFPENHQVWVTVQKWSEVSDNIYKNQINNKVVENLKGTIVQFCLNSSSESHGPIKTLINTIRTKCEDVKTEELMEQVFNTNGVPQ